MICGIVDSETESVAPVVPESLGMFNFVAGTYEYGGNSYIAADVTDQTGWIAAGGLEVPASQGAAAELILAPLQTFLAACQWTIAIELQLLSTSADAVLFTESNSGDGFFIEIGFDQFEWFATCDDGIEDPFASTTDHLTTGIHKLSVTRIDDHIAISVDGEIAEVDDTACSLPVDGFPMVNFFLGGFSDNTQGAINIRSISFYDPVDDSTLRALST